MLIFIFNIHLSRLQEKIKRLKTCSIGTSGHLVLRINKKIIIRSDIVITFYLLYTLHLLINDLTEIKQEKNNFMATIFSCIPRSSLCDLVSQWNDFRNFFLLEHVAM